MLRRAFEVAFSAYGSIILALCFLQFQPHPLAIFERDFAYEADRACSSISNLNFLANFELRHCRYRCDEESIIVRQ